MKLSSSEKQALLGPFVVGCFVGVFVVYATVAFNSELRLNGDTVSTARCIAEAVSGFVLSVLGTFGVLGAIPVAFHRWRAKENRNA